MPQKYSLTKLDPVLRIYEGYPEAIMHQFPTGKYYKVDEAQAIFAHKDLEIGGLKKMIWDLVQSMSTEDQLKYGFNAKKISTMRKSKWGKK